MSSGRWKPTRARTCGAPHGGRIDNVEEAVTWATRHPHLGWIDGERKRKGGQACFYEYLKTVADAENWAIFFDKGFQLPAKFGKYPLGPDGSSPHVISVREAAWKN